MKKTFTFLFLLLANHFAFCQWSTNPLINNAVCVLGGSTQNLPQIVSDGNGGAIILWRDNRNSISETFAQRINSNGVSQWAATGVQVIPTPPSTIDQHPAIIADGNGGAIISWSSFIPGGTQNIYVQKIDANGTNQWGAGGIIICSALQLQDLPKLTSDGNGGAIVCWEDFRNGFENHLYAQRVNAAGITQWTADGEPVTQTGNQFTIQITGDGSGGAIIAWEDTRSVTGVDVYAQRVNAAGVMQWTTDGIALASAIGGSGRKIQLIQDAGGAIICWEDRRNGIDYNVYAQKINAAGSIQWAGNGAGICQAVNDQRDAQLTTDGSGGAIITWRDNRSVTSNTDIYVQRINSLGTVAWIADGIAICTQPNQQNLPQLTHDGISGAIITWSDRRNANIADIYGQRVNASGAALWTIDGVAISIAVNNQTFPKIINDGTNGMIITWEDTRNDISRPDIYAQRVNSNGTLGGGGALPVTLLNFEAHKINNKVQLHWQTASEQNSDHFNIERSADGRQFILIGTVTAAGNSQTLKNYYFTDNTPSTGINYYRLKQVDIDGRFTYSPVRIINNDGDQLIFTLSPNPTTAFINIVYSGKKEMVTICIYDRQGRLVKQQTQRNELPIKVEVKQLVPGIYFISLVDGETVQKGKFIKH